MSVEVYLALGSNEVNPEAILRRAIRAIHQWPTTQVKRISSFYQTRPVGGPPGQAPYLNGMIAIETEFPPHALLATIHELEKQYGRERLIPMGPRPLDVDIIFYGEKMIDEPNLKIPHPRHLERDFVLIPLQEIHHSGILFDAQTIQKKIAALSENNMIQPIAFPRKITEMATQLSDLVLKKNKEKLTALTVEQPIMAQLCSQGGVDILFVTDNLAQVIERNQGAFVVADLPHRPDAGIQRIFDEAEKQLKIGAQMVKLFANPNSLPLIQKLKAANIPVCVHLSAELPSIDDLAQQFTQAGAQLCLLESVSPTIAKKITQTLKIPVIGHHSGSHTDGQMIELSHHFLNQTSLDILRTIQSHVTQLRKGDCLHQE